MSHLAEDLLEQLEEGKNLTFHFLEDEVIVSHHNHPQFPYHLTMKQAGNTVHLPLTLDSVSHLVAGFSRLPFRLSLVRSKLFE